MVRVVVKRTSRGFRVTINGKEARKIAHSSRAIYADKNYVVKVDRHIGSGQWRDEVKLWKSLHDNDRGYFAELVASGRGWVCMKRVRGRHTNIPDWAHYVVRGLAMRYGLTDIEAYPGESKEERRERWGYTNDRVWNWMMTKDGPVIYDYGI